MKRADIASVSFSEALMSTLRSARSLAVLTGAGISAESGIPTFREAQTGLWAKYEPQQLATPEAFLDDPALVWSWYDWRRRLINAASPNPGHLALVKFERKFVEFTLITQNVDGLHKQAGSNSMLELHGNIHRSRCWTNGHTFEEWIYSRDNVPTCPKCEDILRPDVVWFGEQLPSREIAGALEAVRTCDVLLSVGTSAVVYPAAALIPEAVNSGSSVIEINIEPSASSAMADYVLIGKSGHVLPNLYAELFN